MGKKSFFNHNLSTFGWGALLIWWGISVLIDPITLAMSAIGTGLIMLGLNAVRYLKGIPMVRTTTTLGIIALAWGALDQARIALHYPAGASFALLLLVIGLVIWVTVLLPQRQTTAE